METLKILSLLLLIFIVGCKKEEINPDVKFKMTNPINSFEYEIEVIKRNSSTGVNPNVLFVLDPEDLVPIILDQYEESNLSSPLTIIAIKSLEERKRVRDYTPTEIDSEESGRADEYYNFIEQLVFPELQLKESLDSTSVKTIIGHSIGGLSVCYSFTNYNQLFDNYVALSPALFWDNFVFFDIENSKRDLVSQSQGLFFIGIGENEDFGISNGYDQAVTIFNAHYPNVILSNNRVSGSHYSSREELIEKSLKFVLQ